MIHAFQNLENIALQYATTMYRKLGGGRQARLFLRYYHPRFERGMVPACAGHGRQVAQKTRGKRPGSYAVQEA